MYKISKCIEVSAAHRIKLDYESKCTNIHGHNWIITVYCQSEKLNNNGMIIDFTEIKNIITDALDHKVLNDVLTFNPTAENIARWICDKINTCYKVTVEESKNNIASYEEEIEQR